MIKTSIPGIKAREAVISDACRNNHTSDKAFNTACGLLFKEYQRLCRIWPIGKEVKFHVVLTIERTLSAKSLTK